MTLFRRLTPGAGSYLLINIILAGIILLVFSYSLIYSPEGDKYPVQCIHEKITGKPCPSCGLSHSFSYLVRANITEAADWNMYGLRVFIFFLFQLVMRASVSITLIRKKRSWNGLILFDVIVSTISFIAGLGQFGLYYISLLRAG